MSTPVTLTIGNADPALKFTTINDLLQVLRVVLTGELPDFNTYVISSVTPAVDDQGKIWYRIDGNRRPLGLYSFYAGRWVLIPPALGAEFGFFNGDPTVNFDGTGKGLAGSGAVASKYFGWAICNGNNGTPNLSDRFIIGARMDNVDITGWNAGTGLWETNVSGTAVTVGGEAEAFLNEDNTYQPAVPALKGSHYMADGNTRSDSGAIWGSNVSGESEFDVIAADPGNTSPDAIRIVPPYYAMAIIKFIGYP